MLLRQQRARDGDDDLIGRDRAARRLDSRTLAAVIDAAHRTIEHDRQICAGSGDDRTEPFDHAPVHAAIRVAVEVFGRNAIPLGAADIGTDGIDQSVPAAPGFERSRARNVDLVRRDLLEARIECVHRLLEFALLGARETDRQRPARPWRRSFVDGGPLFLRNGDQWIAIGGMQPAAAEVQSRPRRVAHGPCPAAEPRARFNNETIDGGVAELPRGGNSGRAATDNYDLDIAAYHRELWLNQTFR